MALDHLGYRAYGVPGRDRVVAPRAAADQDRRDRPSGPAELRVEGRGGAQLQQRARRGRNVPVVQAAAHGLLVRSLARGSRRARRRGRGGYRGGGRRRRLAVALRATGRRGQGPRRLRDPEPAGWRADPAGAGAPVGGARHALWVERRPLQRLRPPRYRGPSGSSGRRRRGWRWAGVLRWLRSALVQRCVPGGGMASARQRLQRTPPSGGGRGGEQRGDRASHGW